MIFLEVLFTFVSGVNEQMLGTIFHGAWCEEQVIN